MNQLSTTYLRTSSQLDLIDILKVLEGTLTEYQNYYSETFHTVSVAW